MPMTCLPTQGSSSEERGAREQRGETAVNVGQKTSGKSLSRGHGVWSEFPNPKNEIRQTEKQQRSEREKLEGRMNRGTEQHRGGRDSSISGQEQTDEWQS